MEMLWEYGKAFVVGGLICLVGQILIDKTKLTPARILVLFVTLGVVLTAVGLYGPLVDFAGAGATVPLTGFGLSLIHIFHDRVGAFVAVVINRLQKTAFFV